MRRKLIVIEGLDCCFKETAATTIERNRNYDCEDGHEILKVSFPNYSNNSSYFIKEYLNGRYNTLSPERVTELFMLDMYDRFSKELNTLLNSKKINGGIDVVCDRYWYSNIYYQGVKKDVFDYALKLSKEFRLPTPSLVIFMDNTPNNMFKILGEKYNKDSNESNKEYLSEVYLRYHSFLKNDVKKLNLPLYKILKCYDLKTKETRSKESIARSILKFAYEVLDK